jgi:hypothetical protein
MPEGIAVGEAIVGKFLLQPDKFDAARLASQVRSAW